VDLGVLHGKPHSEVAKLKQFMDVFKALSGNENNDVEERLFIGELLKTGKFTEEEAKNYFNKAKREGQIYERRPGFWAKA
jgi:replicative DNA helicase Mcm